MMSMINQVKTLRRVRLNSLVRVIMMNMFPRHKKSVNYSRTGSLKIESRKRGLSVTLQIRMLMMVVSVKQQTQVATLPDGRMYVNQTSKVCKESPPPEKEEKEGYCAVRRLRRDLGHPLPQLLNCQALVVRNCTARFAGVSDHSCFGKRPPRLSQCGMPLWNCGLPPLESPRLSGLIVALSSGVLLLDRCESSGTEIRNNPRLYPQHNSVAERRAESGLRWEYDAVNNPTARTNELRAFLQHTLTLGARSSSVVSEHQGASRGGKPASADAHDPFHYGEFLGDAGDDELDDGGDQGNPKGNPTQFSPYIAYLDGRLGLSEECKLIEKGSLQVIPTRWALILKTITTMHRKPKARLVAQGRFDTELLGAGGLRNTKNVKVEIPDVDVTRKRQRASPLTRSELTAFRSMIGALLWNGRCVLPQLLGDTARFAQMVTKFIPSSIGHCIANRQVSMYAMSDASFFISWLHLDPIALMCSRSVTLGGLRQWDGFLPLSNVLSAAKCYAHSEGLEAAMLLRCLVIEATTSALQGANYNTYTHNRGLLDALTRDSSSGDGVSSRDKQALIAIRAIRDLYRSPGKCLKVHWVPTTHMVADRLTKRKDESLRKLLAARFAY
eukprot:3173481-Amphidinium_carterae.1